jgi:hypothetical protein
MVAKKVIDYVLLRQNKKWTGYAEMFYDVENLQKKFVGSDKNRRKWQCLNELSKVAERGRSITGLQELGASLSIRACTM